uniref:Glutathione transferase n=1 Tax=Zooxanthella nutricula TaxID=1333877 RepID=A0A7S2LXF7_9DINO
MAQAQAYEPQCRGHRSVLVAAATMSVKLYYFGLRARGEALRMMMRYGGLPYEDHIVPFKDWLAGKKEQVPAGRTGQRQLPLLELPGGDLLPESFDIAMYIAKRTTPSLLGEDPAQAERLFKLGDTEETPFGSGFKHYHSINPMLNRLPKEEAEALIPAYVAALPGTLKYLAGELGGRRFFGGDAPHYADFQVWHYVDNMRTLDGGATLEALGEPGEVLQAWYDAVAALPGVAEYLASRPRLGTGQVGLEGSIHHAVAVPSELPVVREALKQRAAGL